MISAIKDALTVAEAHPAWVAAVLFALALAAVTKQLLTTWQKVIVLTERFAAAVETSNATSRELLERVERIERRLDRGS